MNLSVFACSGMSLACKLWSNIVALLLAGYMVAHFVYLVMFSSVTFAQEWRYLRQFEPYLVGSFDSQYLFALILFSFGVYYSCRQMSHRKDAA
jgi:hypothetical protein